MWLCIQILGEKVKFGFSNLLSGEKVIEEWNS